ncbi:uroporphyrinogen-III C-methyltransferase [uncultured Spirosoma sp.]|uniref:uroporphyrinogen-III C-methyltransferase n=1 Tax=uncultured Spirosoma sp. TaxID=278208 RepID=UPI002586ED92|nr:uroporphyrinogen-III C-methyltransferase [uncultured Spirosoma sp.]
MNKLPKLTLIGAGPGDPELITYKAVKALQTADAVLYDALVHPDILRYAPASAELVYVGKRPWQQGKDGCEFAQQDINHLIVQYAHSHGHVVRLKGGDPFVFGRGFEELVFAQDCGVETAVVPGLSSSYAVPALAGIPLTCRGVSESFWVLTGTTKAHQLSDDVAVAVRSSATLVVLMGMKHLPDIVQLLAEAGRGDEPVAVIQNGSRPDEQVALATADQIVRTVTDRKLSNPAIIVIGAVVALHPDWTVVDKRVQLATAPVLTATSR